MTQPAAPPTVEVAPSAPGLDRRALAAAALASRAGFAIFIPGECLKPESQLWTKEQYEQGIWAKGVFLTASEEEDAVVAAGRENKLPAVVLFQMRKSFFAIASDMVYDDPEKPDEKTHGPGGWKLIPTLDQRAYWDELGTLGRTFFTTAYQLANTPSQAAQEVALRSFRRIA